MCGMCIPGGLDIWDLSPWWTRGLGLAFVEDETYLMGISRGRDVWDGQFWKMPH